MAFWKKRAEPFVFRGLVDPKIAQSVPEISPEAMEILLCYDQPGNIWRQHLCNSFSIHHFRLVLMARALYYQEDSLRYSQPCSSGTGEQASYFRCVEGSATFLSFDCKRNTCPLCLYRETGKIFHHCTLRIIFSCFWQSESFMTFA